MSVDNSANTSRSTSQILIALILFLVFTSPFWFLIFSGVSPVSPFTESTLRVFGFTILQAVFSALLAVVFGLIGAYGLTAAEIRWGASNGKLLGALSLLPNVAPVLLFLLAVMKFLPGARGISGIIVVHALLNIGLVSTAITRLFRDKVAGLADLAYIEGSTKFSFAHRVVWPLLKTDLRTIFLFVFAICFSSLAVPLMIGGSRATTTEVLIWQYVRIEGAFSTAMGIAILQLAAILALTILLRRNESSTQSKTTFAPQPLLASSWGLPVVLFPSALLVIGMLDRPWIGASQVFAQEVLRAELFRNFFGSFGVAIGSGLTVIALLMLIAFVDPRGAWRKFFLGYVAPSSVITGFAIVLFWRETGSPTYIKIIFALTLITTPAFYRLYWDAALLSLRGQRIIAQSLGASEVMIFSRIIVPQLVRPAFFIAGLTSLWAWGDFATSRVIAERDLTLAMTVQSLMGTYRFDMATFLVWILLAGGACTFLIFGGVGRVLSQKPSR